MAKAKKKMGVWGIDVGQCALKALRLEANDGQVTATAFDYVEYPKILNQPDADPDQLTREALETFLSRNSLQGDLVAVSVPGQSGLARFVKLPPVEEKKIAEIVKFEAKQQIPFPLEEVIWDFQKIGSGAVTDGFAMDTEIGLFAMKRDMVNRVLQHFKDVKIEVHVVQMAPLALCNYIAYDLLKKGRTPEGEEETGEDQESEEEEGFKKRCIVALDIGTDNSNLVITDAERIIWQRPIPQGGNHFTRALTKELKLTFAKAEHIKRNATKSPDLKKILSALKPVLTDFVGEVQRSLGYFTNTHRDAQVAFMMGLGNAFRLPGLQKFLSEKLQLEVRKLQKLERMTGEEVIKAPSFAQNMLSFGVAYGLALQGLKLARIQTNLLPPDIQTERMVRAKKPWAVTAAAALLLGATAMAVGFGMQYRALADPVIDSAISTSKSFISDVQSKKSAAEAAQAEVDKNEEAARSVMAGMEERDDWLRIERFVDECLPVPGIRIDGTISGRAPGKTNEYVIVDQAGRDRTFPVDSGTLVNGNPATEKDLTKGAKAIVTYQPDPNALKYWMPSPKTEAQKAMAAFDQFWGRTTGKSSDTAKGDSEGSEYLIQVNLEGLDARYSSDLKTYYSTLKAEKAGALEAMAMTKSDQDNPPDGKGWVIELRGYTYHHDQRQFLKDTLLHSLQTRAALPASAVPAIEVTTKAKAGDEAKKPVDAILGQVSHALLYRYEPDDNPDPFSFHLIGSSVLPKLVANFPTEATASGASGGGSGGSGGGASGGSGGGASGGSGGSMGGGAGSGSDSWTSLLTGSSTGSGSPQGPGGTSGPKTTVKSAGPTRTEFIMLFIWKEPTPSEDRMAQETGGAKGGLGRTGGASGGSGGGARAGGSGGGGHAGGGGRAGGSGGGSR